MLGFIGRANYEKQLIIKGLGPEGTSSSQPIKIEAPIDSIPSGFLRGAIELSDTNKTVVDLTSYAGNKDLLEKLIRSLVSKDPERALKKDLEEAYSPIRGPLNRIVAAIFYRMPGNRLTDPDLKMSLVTKYLAGADYLSVDEPIYSTLFNACAFDSNVRSLLLKKGNALNAEQEFSPETNTTWELINHDELLDQVPDYLQDQLLGINLALECLSWTEGMSCKSGKIPLPSYLSTEAAQYVLEEFMYRDGDMEKLLSNLFEKTKRTEAEKVILKEGAKFQRSKLQLMGLALEGKTSEFQEVLSQWRLSKKIRSQMRLSKKIITSLLKDLASNRIDEFVEILSQTELSSPIAKRILGDWEVNKMKYPGLYDFMDLESQMTHQLYTVELVFRIINRLEKNHLGQAFVLLRRFSERDDEKGKSPSRLHLILDALIPRVGEKIVCNFLREPGQPNRFDNVSKSLIKAAGFGYTDVVAELANYRQDPTAFSKAREIAGELGYGEIVEICNAHIGLDSMGFNLAAKASTLNGDTLGRVRGA